MLGLIIVALGLGGVGTFACSQHIWSRNVSGNEMLNRKNTTTRGKLENIYNSKISQNGQ